MKTSVLLLTIATLVTTSSVWGQSLSSTPESALVVPLTHADDAGGLAFLESAHESFGPLAVGISSVLSAEAAFRIGCEVARIDTFKAPLIVLSVIAVAAIARCFGSGAVGRRTYAGQKDMAISAA